MAELSHKFSTTSIHADLPFQSLAKPTDHVPLSFAQHFHDQSTINLGLHGSPPQFAQRQSPEISEDSTSTYSSYGDLLPDEVAEHVQTSCGHRGSNMQDANTGGVLSLQKTNTGKSVRHRLRPQPLQLGQERRFSFDKGDDSGLDFSELSWSQDGVIGVRRSLSLSHLQETREKQARSGADPPRLKTPKVVTELSPLPSPVLPTSPGLSKIPSPVFDASLARPRREDSTSSFVTAVRHSDTSTSNSETGSYSTSRLSNTSSRLADTRMHSPQAISNRSSSESGKTTGGEKLIREKNSLRGTPIAIAAARAAGVSSARNSASEIKTPQRGSANIHPRQPRLDDEQDGRIKENVGSMTSVATSASPWGHK